MGGEASLWEGAGALLQTISLLSQLRIDAVKYKRPGKVIHCGFRARHHVAALHGRSDVQVDYSDIANCANQHDDCIESTRAIMDKMVSKKVPRALACASVLRKRAVATVGFRLRRTLRDSSII